jgi:hypothetical protein
MVEISGELNDHIDKGEIAAPGIARPNKKNVPVLRMRILTASGKHVQVLHKGDYFGNATIGDKLTIKGIDKGGLIYAKSIYNNTTNSWITKSPGHLNCFIATAVYGSPYAKEIIYLRFFRDNYLIKKKGGELIIDIYYKISPFIAKLIEKNQFLKVVANHLFLKPFIKVIKIYLGITNVKDN